MEDVKDRIDLTVVGKVIAADIATRFGQTVDAQPHDISHKGEDSYLTLDIEQNFGAFKMIINDAKLRLRVANCTDGTTYVAVSLNYSHVSGGTNGSNVGTWWLRDGEIEHFRAG